VVLWLLPDRPSDAPWLAADERAWLETQLERERRAGGAGRSHSVLQGLANPWVLFLGAVYFTNVCLMNSVLFFLPKIVRGFGVGLTQVGFVVAIPSLLALFAVVWWGRRSDARRERYGHAAAANLLGGAALLASVLLTDPVARMAAISVAFAATLSFFSPFWALPGSFLSGAAAAGGIAAISAVGVTGGFLSPWIVGLLKDATGDYQYGLGGVACLAMFAAVVFYWVGTRRDRALAAPVNAAGQA
jgi:cyanate permease